MNKKYNCVQLVTTMVITLAMVAGLYTLTSYQSSYASLINADDSDCAIFCPSLDFQLDNSVSQNNNCGNSQVNPGNGVILPEEFGNSTESTETFNCNNTAPVR